MKTIEEFMNDCESAFKKFDKDFTSGAKEEAVCWYESFDKTMTDEVVKLTAEDLAEGWNDEKAT